MTITMHIETDAVRMHPFHLGTELSVAESFVFPELRKPGVKTVALRDDEKLIRIYDYRDLPENADDADQKFYVKVINDGTPFWLNRTVFRFDPSRAAVFDSREAAQAALDKAKPFMVPSIRRKAFIIPVSECRGRPDGLPNVGE